MPFNRPTLSELIERAVSDLDSRIPGADARLRSSNLGVLARVHSGAVHSLYGYLDFISRQIMPDTAEAEYLERWASIWGISRKPAASACGWLTLTASRSTVISGASTWQRSDGALFILDPNAVGPFIVPAMMLPVVAVVAGLGGNTAAGSTLTIVNPISGVDSAAIVFAPGLTGASDIETDAELLARLLARIRNPPHGGAAFDYVAWALEVPGVTRAWCYPLYTGDGTVGIFFVCDNDASIIPNSAKVLLVQNYINTVRPVTAAATVYAPTAHTLNLTISVTPNTDDVKSAVTAELTDLLSRDSAPGATIYLSRIREAVSLAAGETNNSVTLPAADFTSTAAQMAVLGAITWV
jgi:uncharacterized phage protein gp47/JayE